MQHFHLGTFIATALVVAIVYLIVSPFVAKLGVPQAG